MSETSTRTTHEFQTEARQLLDLMIHSLYSNKEIFLRELISNASDACDKLRFEALTDAALLEEHPDLAVEVEVDPTARTITVTDNGVGMSRQEVIDNIGTIAKSGTREFVAQLTGDQTQDAQLIGQFGVGFYSSFIVADRVTLTTRRAGLGAGEAVRWESTGEGEYTLEAVAREARGTEVVLHLRDGEDDLLSGPALRAIVQKYSDHITIPILMKKEEVPGRQADTGDVETTEKVNQASALWARPKTEITREQYDEFYKHVAHDFDVPLAHTHARVEGRQEYTLLLYVPRRAPFDLWDREQRHGIKLYVRRVFIMDGAKELMPGYLRFVRGLIDSNDLPLNISREILQHSRDVEAIRNAAVKRVLGLLGELAENEPDKYADFWREFGRVLKEGIGEDVGNQERLGKLLRFASTHRNSAEQSVSLADYAARMKDGQEKIYYVTADSFAAAQNSPHLEVFRKKGVEVLLLHDRVDEWVMAHMPAFDGKSLQSVTKGDLDLGGLADTGEEAQQKEETEADMRPVAERIGKALGDKAKEVRLTHRLVDSPACLVTEQDGMSANLERVLRAAGQAVPNVPLVLEINPEHPIVTRLKEETDDARFKDWSHILFDQAMLAEGGHLDDPAGFVKRLNELMLAMAGEPQSRIWTPGS
ncbi:MAG: molecular chaperone HtpG [Acidobacteria bacterium]|nr:molecular chaperone HtpG [Acidobacteriota bacterium]